MNHRKTGTSLIEIMVTMSVGSTILIIAIGWIHQSMTLSSAMRQRQAQHQRLLVWSRQFRDDVRTSRSVEQLSPDEIVITEDNGSIRYSIEANGLQRQRKRTDGPTTLELLPIPDPSLVTLRVNQEDPQQVEWIIERSLPVSDASSRSISNRVDLAIIATVGAALPEGVAVTDFQEATP